MHELHKILERTLQRTNLDKYKLIDLSMEQHGDSSHEHTGVGMAPTSDTGSTSGLALRGGQGNCGSGLEPCQGSFLSSPNGEDAG